MIHVLLRVKDNDHSNSEVVQVWNSLEQRSGEIGGWLTGRYNENT